MIVDSRLIGTTAENMFLSLLNQRGVFAHSFDTVGFDGIAFDLQNRLFKVGASPSYLQIKCRGSSGEQYSTQGHSPETIEAIRDTARQLQIPEESLYFVVGFFRNNDIRETVYYVIPLGSLPPFRGNAQYRFSVQRCEQMVRSDPGMTKL